MEEEPIHNKKDATKNEQNINTEQENLIKVNAQINHEKNGKGRNDNVKNMLLLLCIMGVSLGIMLEIINVQLRNKNVEKKKYIVWSMGQDVDDKNGILKHVHLVLERIGYEKTINGTEWDLLWAHDYPFNRLYSSLNKLKPYPASRVNHFPGIGYVTNKVNLATMDSKYIPKAFRLPEKKDAFLKYAAENKNLLFLEKHNEHRGVLLKNVSDINYDGLSFVQEFIPNPFLVDGYKFDIGVYVVMTSVKPLRLYWYKGDVLFRFCPAKYHPLNVTNLDQYVIGNDYLPLWKVPALAQTYSELGLSMKDAFDLYATSKGKNVTKMWDEIQKAIVEVFLAKVDRESIKYYASQDNFFEMMRVDLIVDENLRVYLLEVNMSPNLSSAHFPPNQLLYEQVLYNLFSITGIANDVIKSDLSSRNMVSSQKNIAVLGKKCIICEDSCEVELCQLCRPCITRTLKDSLLRAHREFLHRADFRRLFPPPMVQGPLPNEGIIKDLTDIDRLQYLWYQGKCNLDITWCT